MKKSVKIKRKRKRKILIWVFFILIILGLSCKYFERNVTPIIINYCSAKVETLTVNAVNSAITMVINDGIDYSDLVDVLSDGEGNITAIKARSAKINLLARQVSSIALQNVEKISKKGIKVPIGAFLNSAIIAGYGSEITVNFISTGSVDCCFTSEFSEASINHTLHKIFIKVNADISLIIPFSDTVIKTTSEILVSECVLIGKVPDTYLKSAELNDMVDLIP